jgi:hypothetical protein
VPTVQHRQFLRHQRTFIGFQCMIGDSEMIAECHDPVAMVSG